MANQDFADVERHARDLSRRTIWAAPLANGATLLALIGMLGSIHNPDAAVHALKGPLTMLTLGLIAGGVGAVFARAGATHMAAATAYQRLRSEALTNLTLLNERGLTIPISIELARILRPQPGAAEAWIGQLYQTANEHRDQNAKRANAQFEDAEKPEEENRKLGNKFEGAGTLLSIASGALCVGALWIAIIGIGGSTPLQPEDEPTLHLSTTPAAAQPTTSPSASVSILLPPGALLEIRDPRQPATISAATPPASQPVAEPKARRGGR